MWEPLVICGVTPGPDIAKALTEPCNWFHLMQLVKNLITDLVIISTFLATAVFAYAGLKLMTSGGDMAAMKYAKGVLGKVVMGYLWILGAWLIIYTITKVLLRDEFRFLLGAS